MYTVLIVDDNKDRALAERTLIMTESTDCDVFVVQSDFEAGEFISKKQTDILITELSGLNIDAWRLIDRTLMHRSETQIVICADTGDFESARRAMKKGIREYIVRAGTPTTDSYGAAEEGGTRYGSVMAENSDGMSDGRLTDELSRDIMDAVNSSLDILRAWERDRGHLELGRISHIQHMLYELIYSEDAEIDTELVRQEIAIYHRMLLIETESEFFSRVGNDPEGRINAITGEPCRYLNLNPQQSIVLLETASRVGPEREAVVRRISDSIIDLLQRGFGEKTYIAVSGHFDMKTGSDSGTVETGYDRGEKSLCRIFEEVESLMDEKFYNTGRQVYMMSEMYSGAQQSEDSSLEDDAIIRNIRTALSVKDESMLRSEFGRITNKYRTEAAASQIYIKHIFSNIIKMISECSSQEVVTDDDTQSVMESLDEMKYIERLYLTTSFEESAAVVEECVDIICERFGASQQTSHRETEKVKQYIYENYASELSLDTLAAKVYMTPSYLSYVFKQETGQNLSKFIKAFRMTKAAELLKDTDKKIVDVSEDVGYANVSYFCQSFRDYFGVSPQRFRENL